VRPLPATATASRPGAARAALRNTSPISRSMLALPEWRS
jgi:hypothetical protein